MLERQSKYLFQLAHVPMRIGSFVPVLNTFALRCNCVSCIESCLMHQSCGATCLMYVMFIARTVCGTGAAFAPSTSSSFGFGHASAAWRETGSRGRGWDGGTVSLPPHSAMEGKSSHPRLWFGCMKRRCVASDSSILATTSLTFHQLRLLVGTTCHLRFGELP